MYPWILLLVLGAQVDALPLSLDFDLGARELRVVEAGSSSRYALPEDASPENWDSFVRAIAAQRWDAELARAWGLRLFPESARERLRGAAHWRIADPELAGIEAVIPPWEASSPLLRSVRVDFGNSPSHGEPTHVDTALILEPFVGTDPTVDVPDTTEAALARGLRHLTRLPRNDVDAAVLSAALREQRDSLLLLRARTRLPSGWLGALPSASPIRIWTWPVASPWIDTAEFGSQCAALARGASLLWADRWSLSEAARASDLLALFRLLEDGHSAGAATTLCKRALLEAGAPPSRWAGWILLGESERELRLDGPRWWQRWVRERKAKSLQIQLPD